MDRAILIQMLVNAFAVAFFIVYILPRLQQGLGFFTAVMFFASLQVIAYGFSRYLVNQTKSSLILVVAGGFGILLLFSGLLNAGI